MSATDQSAAQAAAATASQGDQKGRINKALIIKPSDLPTNTYIFFRMVNPAEVADRYVHWIKLPQLTKEIPIPCMATAAQHAEASSWMVPDICPMCRMAHEKDPIHARDRYNPEKPNIQHQWMFKVNPLVPIRSTDPASAGKITGQTINPNVHVLQLTQATLFKAISAAKDDPELPLDPPLNMRALKLYKELAPGAEPKETKYKAAYSQSVLGPIPALTDTIPTIEELETVWTMDEFNKFMHQTPKAPGGAKAEEKGQQAPSQPQVPGTGAAVGGAAPATPPAGGRVASDDSEF